MNVSWNGAAFAGNPIPPNKHIPESIETNSYNSAFTGDHHNQEYNNHFETTTEASISSSKSSPDVTRNPNYAEENIPPSNTVEQKYIPTTNNDCTSNDDCTSLSSISKMPKSEKSDDHSEINEVKKELNNTNASSETLSPPDESRKNLVAHVILAARAQALQLERSGLPSISSLPLSLLDTPKLRSERPGKRSKSYSCSFCGHRTSQKQSLTQHIQSVHENLKPFECQWEGCSYNCSTKQNLDKHIKGVHEKLKPNTCPFCDSSFSQKVTLDNHVRGVHSKVKPFQCPLCSYAAAYRGNLNSHIMSVHEKRKPYACPAQCGYSCTQKSGLKRHKCS